MIVIKNIIRTNGLQTVQEFVFPIQTIHFDRVIAASALAIGSPDIQKCYLLPVSGSKILNQDSFRFLQPSGTRLFSGTTYSQACMID
ncbi:MAG TPA: hypothetical protein VFM05_06105 [Candidatus Saccharimonadales bacterium]|nr:hypothetical protein [Candidatus Saccharimonadales bacterium]